MHYLWDALGVPSARIPINATAFISYVLPPFLCYFAVAVLVIMPQTRIARVVLWPIFVLLALRAAASVTISNGKPGLAIFDSYLSCAMFILSARTLEWAFAKEPLVRHIRPANTSPSTIMDAFDLVINLRGYGWNWSSGFTFPQDPRPKNRFTFALYVVLSAIGHLFLFGISKRAILSFYSPGSIAHGGLFDETLPCLVKYVRASVIVSFQYIMSYSSSQASYDIGTLIGVLLCGQEPTQWPPVFDAPWRSTSLTEYWGRRWHQWFRHVFLFLGGYPLSRLIGRPGITIGVFLVSGVMHAIFAIGIGSMAVAWDIFLGLMIMPLPKLAEWAFYRFTGKKVGGVVGAIWTLIWALLSGMMIFDGWMKMGVLGDNSLIDSVWPVRMAVERLIRGLDALFHAI